MSKDFYEETSDPDFEMDMEMYPKEAPKELIKIYGGALIFVLGIILPWFIGMCTLAKWFFKWIF
jgi:hypothetical protein